MPHKPVLLKPALDLLRLAPGAVVLDGTLGGGAHAEEILKIIGPRGRFIGLDQDPMAIERCLKRLKDYPQALLKRANFRNGAALLDSLQLPGLDAVIFDIGLSSDQLDDPARGLSFLKEGPLDMRMDPESELTARTIVNEWSERDLERTFREYGEERSAAKFARSIVYSRRQRPMETTADLAAAVLRAFGPYKKTEFPKRPGWAKKHPATRVFQALRIAVNDELNALKEGLKGLWEKLKPRGRMVVISFHSLEDRIVKHQFQDWRKEGVGKILTKKPITASREEVISNPRARSAKMRGIEKNP